MNYLFFDLEYATSANNINKICEFGFVVTNENFEVKERGNYIINPNIKSKEWDHWALKHILTRTKEEYINSKMFYEYYDKIKELFKSSDKIFAHTINSDAKALNCECKRYELESLNYDVLDLKDIYCWVNKDDNKKSLSNILKELKLEGENKKHDAEADAYNTMLCLKEINRLFNLDSVIDICPEAMYKNKNYRLKYPIHFNKKKIEENYKKILLSNNNEISEYKKMVFDKYVKNINEHVEHNNENIRYSITANYEENNYLKMLNLIRLVAEKGGIYSQNCKQLNVFIKYNDDNSVQDIDDCPRLAIVDEAIAKGKDIKIIDYDTFLNKFNLKRSEVENINNVDYSLYVSGHKNKNNNYINKEGDKSHSLTCTIGELCPDINNFRNNNNSKN